MIETIILAGIMGCLFMDIWQRMLFRLSGIAPSNMAMIGRWAYRALGKGMIFQPDIDMVDAYRNEVPFGWFFHYVIGVVYAVIYAFLIEVHLLSDSLMHGLLFGALSVIVPWFFFLPATGKGVLAQQTPTPLKICVLAFITHCIFGIGIAFGFQIAS